MNEQDESLRSRRSFMRIALVGAAGTLMDNQQASNAYFSAEQKQSDSDVTQLSLSEVSQLVRRKKVSPFELTNACLRRIDRLNAKLNAFITVMRDSAQAEARRAEAEIQNGNWKGPLHGIPIALKDLVDTAGVPTTAATGIFKNRIPTEDAEIVRRLKTAGAVVLGKLNLHECAFGGSSAVSYFGPVHNPWNVEYSPGGSSGGSAAAVASRLCYAAIGTDTGGSIRQPAAYCGVVGLKPSYGRVSTSGVIPLSWSLDHVGPITRNVLDAALMLKVIAGYDSKDTASIDVPVPDYSGTIAAPTSRLRIGILRACFYDELQADIQASMKAALWVLKKITASQEEIPPLATDATYSSWMTPYSAILTAEAYAYHKEYIDKTPELYQPLTLKRLRQGADVTASTYIHSRRQLDHVRRSIAQVFAKVDLLITPTVRVPPLMIADLTDLETARAKELTMLHNTRPLNFPGLPTISVPCGFTREGLPIGMQITGRFGDEATVLRLAHAYEQATEWHTREPNLR